MTLKRHVLLSIGCSTNRIEVSVTSRRTLARKVFGTVCRRFESWQVRFPRDPCRSLSDKRPFALPECRRMGSERAPLTPAPPPRLSPGPPERIAAPHTCLSNLREVCLGEVGCTGSPCSALCGGPCRPQRGGEPGRREGDSLWLLQGIMTPVE